MPQVSKKILQKLPQDKLSKIERNDDESEIIELKEVHEDPPEEQDSWWLQEISKATKQQDRSGFLKMP